MQRLGVCVAKSKGERWMSCTIRACNLIVRILIFSFVVALPRQIFCLPLRLGRQVSRIVETHVTGRCSVASAPAPTLNLMLMHASAKKCDATGVVILWDTPVNIV